MTLTPSAASTASAFRRRVRGLGLSVAGAVVVFLLVGSVTSCSAVAGGPVRSEAQFLEHVRDTQAVGEDTVRFLGSDPDSAFASTASAFRRRVRGLGLSVAGAVVVFLLVGSVTSCSAVAGGPVRSEAQFLEHVRDTQAVGEDTVRFLGSDPEAVILGKSTDSASCVDDLGVDRDDTRRDQPSVSWAPDFQHGDAGYRAAVADLRRRWSERGWKVTTKQGTDPVTDKATGLQEIHTTDDHGVALSLSPGRRTGEGLVVADGGCVRHDGYWDAYAWSRS
ncbi:hypothetical protein AB5L52_00060 [Streptomyces sp. CG4]|uniref:hypothetical protein n=1 Tax=Streptomyces sp. CG4 TaxID=408783 RepID=UPI0034E1BBFE